MPKTKKETEKKVKVTATKTVKANKSSTKAVKTTKTTKTAAKKPVAKTAKKPATKNATTKKVATKKTTTKKVKTDEKKDVLLQIIANLKTENKRLMDWLTTHKLSKKDKSKIEDNIAFNENAIAHFSEIIK